MLNDPKQTRVLSHLLQDDQKYQELLDPLKPDAETIEILTELRERYQFKLGIPEKDLVTVMYKGEKPKIKLAKFKEIKADANKIDTTLSQ